MNPEAMKVASAAVEHDTAGRWDEAVPLYEQAAAMILASAPSEPDKQTAEQYRARANVLKTQIQARNLQRMQSGMAAAGAVNQQLGDGVQKAGGVAPMAAAAAVGGVAGMALGGSMMAVAGAGAAAYATTRADGIGEAARNTGQSALQAFEAAKKINEEHNLTGKAYEAAQASAAKAKELNEQYKITDKLGAAAAAAAAKAHELETKHNITSKVGSMLGAGMTSLTAAMKGGKEEAPVPPGATLPAVPK